MRSRHRFIFVGSEPYRVWPDHNLVPASLFLEGINHRYFESMANLFQGALKSDTSWAAQMALRTTYGQASEALFALLFSLLQAPYDAAAWLLLYQPGDIAKLIDRFERGEETSKHRYASGRTVLANTRTNAASI